MSYRVPAIAGLFLVLLSSFSFAGPIDVPEGYRVDAIGNGTPEKGVARIRHDGEDWFVPVTGSGNQVYRRASGGTSTVNRGDGISNVHEALSRNAEQIHNKAAAADDVLRDELRLEIENGDANTLAESQLYADQGDVETLNSALEADADVLAEAQAYADDVGAETLESAIGYSDTLVAAATEDANNYADEGDAATLAAALDADADTLADAEAYSDQLHGVQADQISVLETQVSEVINGNGQRSLRLDSLENRQSVLEQRQTATEAAVEELQFAMDRQRQRYREAISAVTALSMVQQDPGANGVQVSVGMGHFQGQNSAAVVVGGKVSERLYFNFGASTGAATAYGASATVRLGGR